MIHIFKTNVIKKSDLNRLRPELDKILGGKTWSFDLEDCDKVFRIVVSDEKLVDQAVEILKSCGYTCEIL